MNAGVESIKAGIWVMNAESGSQGHLYQLNLRTSEVFKRG
jgi:hypothetical protein